MLDQEKDVEINGTVNEPSHSDFVLLRIIFNSAEFDWDNEPAPLSLLFYLRFPAKEEMVLCFLNLSTTGNTMTDATPI